MGKIQRNPEMSGVLAGAGLIAAGLLLILLPLLIGLDGMDGGFALQFGGFFLVVAGLVTAVVFGLRARRFRAILAGRELLAHWTYPPELVRAQAQRDLQEEKRRNRILLLLVAGWTLACVVLFVAIGFWEGQQDDMPLFVAIMAGVLLLVAAFALAMPYLHHRRARRSSGEAYIAANGLFLNGALHTWDPPLGGLDGVSLVEDGDQARLVFRLRALSRTDATLYQHYSVEVPVPPGEEPTARRIEQHFLDL